MYKYNEIVYYIKLNISRLE